MVKNQIERQNYIDWLRVGAMFLLLFYHTGRLFDAETWHIKNSVLSNGVNAFNYFLALWQMPLFFLLAGASVWFALSNRTPGGFTKERVLRLFVPLVFSILIIVPPQVYYERIFDGDFTGSFLAWYPHTFQGTYSMDNAAAGNLSWHHLWFLLYLFVGSLLLLPLFWHLKSEKRKLLISRIAGFFEKPGAIFLPMIPLVIFNLVLVPIFGWGSHDLISDWATFTFYTTIFFYGFLLVSDNRILRVVQRNLYISLIAAVVFSLVRVVLEMDGPVSMSFYAIACWCWLLVIIALGVRFLNFGNNLLKYASNAVMPVYILHQTLIIIIGFYVVQWNIGVAPKYFLVVTATLLGSLAIYEVVKRINVTRFLFGIKVKKLAAALSAKVTSASLERQ